MTVRTMAALVEDLENHLGDPHDPANLFSFERVLRLDEREEFPYEPLGLLRRWDLHQYSLPRQWGGRAGDVEVGFNLLRVVARRDPTTATVFVLPVLSFMPVWIAGTDEQRLRFVAGIKNGLSMSWGVSEREHGSDILANEMWAERTEGGYLLTGEKYLIGNATVSDVIMIHARTGRAGRPGDWTMFALDKRACPAGSVEVLRNEPLHGLRGLDMSGVRLDRAFVPDANIVGGVGRGLEVTLKSAQVARTIISVIALGAVDTALRVTLDFAVRRKIFGTTVAGIPYSRRQLAECFADLILAEAVTTGAVRGLQCAPGQVPVLAPIVKYLVPTMLERTLSQVSIVLGARFFLRDHPHFGVYQKMLRDIWVSVFADGNTVVNLKNIALSLDPLLTIAETATAERRAAARATVATVFDLDAELPEWAPWDSPLANREGDALILALPDAIAGLRGLAAAHEDGAQRGWYERCADLADRMLAELAALTRAQRALRAGLGRAYGSSAELFTLAERYATLHAAAAAIHLVVHSREALADPFPDGALLLLCLERVWRGLHPTETVTDVAVTDRVMEILLSLHRDRRLFSHRRFRIQAAAPCHTA